MSQFHNLFCRSANPYTVEELRELIPAGWFGEGDLELTVAAEAPDGHWREVHLRAVGADGPPPVSLTRDVDPDAVATFTQEVLEEGGGGVSAEATAALQAARQVIGLELRSDAFDDDWWEFLDVVQGDLARQLDAYLVVLGEGIYDQDLQQVADLT